jgi:NAD-dependent SIR2 family protein deacetylase
VSQDPQQAWGFYGHRAELYSTTTPHAGFDVLRRLSETKTDNFFVATSNIDEHFQKAGFSEDCIYECHGSLGIHT